MERAGGNPLFLEELAGLLTDVPGAGTRVNDLPATLRGLVAARIDGLDGAARFILDDAAVVGRDGRVDALAALASARGATLDTDALDELISRELLTEDAGAWSFRSELVRDVAYDTLTKADRARRHAALGLWLTERRRGIGREDDELEPIAHHLGIAASLQQSLGDIDGIPADICPRALRAIERAAMAAKARGLHSGSILLLDRALELLDPTDRPNRHRVLLARAHAYASLRMVEPGTRDIEAVAAELADDERVAWAHVETLRGDLRGTAGDTVGSIQALTRAIELWRAEGDVANEADSLRLAGMAHMLAGQNEKADEFFTQALEAFRSIGARQGEAWVLQNRAWLSFNQGLLDEADERLADAAKAFEEIGDFGGLGFVRGLLGFVRMFQGRFEEAGELAEYILANDRDRNDKWSTGMILMLLSSVRLFTGQPDAAIAPATESAEVFEAMGDTDRLFQARATWRAASSVRDASKRVSTCCAEMFPDSDAMPIGYGVISGSIATQLGEPGLAESALNQPLEASFTLGTVADHEMLVLRGLTSLLAGEAATARAQLQTAADAAANEGQKAYAFGALAVAAAADRDPKAALAAADKAIAAEGGTYLDRQLAKAAQALAFSQQDDRRALVVADDLVLRANGTTDVLAQGTALLVRASVACALRTDDATDHAADADLALETIGAELPGWRDVFARRRDAHGPSGRGEPMSFTTIGVPVTGGTLNVGTREGRQGAPVVILVHGITANHLSWELVAEELGDEVTILAPDLRGRAGSADVPAPFGMRQHAQDLVSILDHVGIDSATVVGHSMGGFVAAAFSHDHGDRLDGLVLVDGGVTIASLPEGADIDAVLTAILGPTMERLSMTFASVDEWLAFWKKHPSLQDWNDAIEGYVMADMRGEPPALRSSCAIEAIRADGADTLGEGGLLFRSLNRPTPWLRAPRGLLNECHRCIPTRSPPHMCAEVPALQDQLIDDVNHFTIALSDHGAKAVAAAIRSQLPK